MTPPQKIGTLVFSFDRAAQLDLLLRSIEEHDLAAGLDVRVIYNSSNERFESGYETLKGRHSNAQFVKEKAFLSPKRTNPILGWSLLNLLLWLRNPRFRKERSNFRALVLEQLTSLQSQLAMFLTDDSLFYQPIAGYSEVLKLIAEQNDRCFSFAHGINLSGSPPMRDNKNFLGWSNTDERLSDFWRYPFSVDGRVYSRVHICEFVNRLNFNSPNTFEAAAVLRHRFRPFVTEMYSFQTSCLVGFELNRVQNQYTNHHLGISLTELNEKFLDGGELVLDFDQREVRSFRPILRSVAFRHGNTIVPLEPNI